MRRADVRTEVERAETVAAAVGPDNTEQMDTRVEDGAVVTTIERGTTGGLRSTVDDYVVNVHVATRTVAHARAHENRHTTGRRVDEPGPRTERAAGRTHDAESPDGNAESSNDRSE